MNIALVNDQELALEALRRVITAQTPHRIVWVARNGAEAVAAAAGRRPDLILMDLIMPQMDGVAATRRIMAATPCPIVIVTTSVGANSWRVFEAMGHGALDAVDTPVIGNPGSTKAFLEKLALIERRAAPAAWPQIMAGAPGRPPPKGPPLVAIGASAGGPMALATLLRTLPPRFAAPIAIVQHVDAQFARGMAQWLNESSALTVRVAQEGDALEPGVALLAGTNDHLVLRDATHVGYTADPREQVYRPSVDVFFGTVASRWPGRVIGVLLTGMGRDGAVGLKVLRNLGHMTMAQDEATCAVYGMPKAAAQLQAAVEVLPLPAIAPRLIELLDPKNPANGVTHA